MDQHERCVHHQGPTWTTNFEGMASYVVVLRIKHDAWTTPSVFVIWLVRKVIWHGIVQGNAIETVMSEMNVGLAKRFAWRSIVVRELLWARVKKLVLPRYEWNAADDKIVWFRLLACRDNVLVWDRSMFQSPDACSALNTTFYQRINCLVLFLRSAHMFKVN